MMEEVFDEAELYQRLSGLKTDTETGPDEELRTTPLLTWSVKEKVERGSACSKGKSKSHVEATRAKVFNQYALLGFHAGQHPAMCKDEIILLNVDAPSSTFVCGSQGSGKSYTLNCMLENCLLAERRIGTVSSPVAGLSFQYDLDSAHSVAETAYLCSMGIRVKVLVSQSNEYALRKAYSAIPGADQNLTVAPLLLQPTDLSIERMHRLMAFADKDTSVPLYMSVALRILREMATNARGSTFDYLEFKQALERENLTKEQVGPLKLRLDLLESYMDLSQNNDSTAPSIVDLEPGTLTIIDLTDPFMDPATACTLFEICLSLVKERRPSCGLVVALDEAHKYMTTSAGASNLTDKLLGTIREQRHNGTRVIIATQEPTISDKLLDLCTVSIIHRFTSPAWFAAIQRHLGAASNMLSSTSAQQEMFDQILNLQVGESLVFAPSAAIHVTEDGAGGKLGRDTIKMRTRQRLGNDGGRSVLASAPNRSHLQSKNSFEIPSRLEPDVEKGNVVSASRMDLSPVKPKSPGTTVEHEGNGGVTLIGENNHPNSSGSGNTPNCTAAHLLLICCSCSSLVVVEYTEPRLPETLGSYTKRLRGATGYTTCATCRFSTIAPNKNAKTFDRQAGNTFRSGPDRRNEALPTTLRTILKPMLGHDVPVLVQSDQAAYLPMRTVQRTIREGVLLWTAQLSQSKNSQRQVTFRTHQDGTFLDSALLKGN